MFKTLLIVTFKNMFFVMSVSGTVVFIFYMLLYPIIQTIFFAEMEIPDFKIGNDVFPGSLSTV